MIIRIPIKTINLELEEMGVEDKGQFATATFHIRDVESWYDSFTEDDLPATAIRMKSGTEYLAYIPPDVFDKIMLWYHNAKPEGEVDALAGEILIVDLCDQRNA